MGGELQAGAQTVEITEYLQAFLRFLGNDPVFWSDHIGISPGFGSSDTASELI